MERVRSRTATWKSLKHFELVCIRFRFLKAFVSFHISVQANERKWQNERNDERRRRRKRQTKFTSFRFALVRAHRHRGIEIHYTYDSIENCVSGNSFYRAFERYNSRFDTDYDQRNVQWIHSPASGFSFSLSHVRSLRGFSFGVFCVFVHKTHTHCHGQYDVFPFSR